MATPGLPWGAGCLRLPAVSVSLEAGVCGLATNSACHSRYAQGWHSRHTGKVSLPVHWSSAHRGTLRRSLISTLPSKTEGPALTSCHSMSPHPVSVLCLGPLSLKQPCNYQTQNPFCGDNSSERKATLVGKVISSGQFCLLSV